VKLYIGCSLTQAPSGFAEAVDKVKDALRADFEVLDFLGLEKGTAMDSYLVDIRRNVATCDVFVAICDYPAIGLGIELGAAIEAYHKPVLALAQTGATVSRMVRAVPVPNYQFVRYDALEDVPSLVRNYIKHLNLTEDNA
jgi:hypothetical protein